MRVPSNVVAMPKREQAPMPPVDPTYLAMAAASMHAEGKFPIANKKEFEPNAKLTKEYGSPEDVKKLESAVGDVPLPRSDPRKIGAPLSLNPKDY
jgi:hypothetical protein